MQNVRNIMKTHEKREKVPKQAQREIRRLMINELIKEVINIDFNEGINKEQQITMETRLRPIGRGRRFEWRTEYEIHSR